MENRIITTKEAAGILGKSSGWLKRNYKSLGVWYQETKYEKQTRILFHEDEINALAHRYNLYGEEFNPKAPYIPLKVRVNMEDFLAVKERAGGAKYGIEKWCREQILRGLKR